MYATQVVLNFIGSREEATPAFRISSPSTNVIKCGTKRKSLSQLGICVPLTFNVQWDGMDDKVSFLN